jgi:C1A family cysteine protease
MSRRYGCIRSVVNHEELQLCRFVEPTDKTSYDLRTTVELPECVNEIDQETLGSCTANAIAFAYLFDELKQNNAEVFMPSRLFIYYNERRMENSIDTDSGAQIADGMKSINVYGVCEEHRYPYIVDNFRECPDDELYAEAKLAHSVNYAQIYLNETDVNSRCDHLKSALVAGFPIVFGFTVFQSFETDEVAQTGNVQVPTPNETELGGHAVCAVGFDDVRRVFIVKNSWGSKWGVNGYFYMPYEYIGNSQWANDFWVIQTTTNPTTIPFYEPSDITPTDINPTNMGVFESLYDNLFGGIEDFATSICRSMSRFFIR